MASTKALQMEPLSSIAHLDLQPREIERRKPIADTELDAKTRAGLGSDENLTPEMRALYWAVRVVLLCFFLYFFLFSLDLMGASFKVLGGCSAGEMFESINNPIAGLMVGILATVLVQSSSTSTSIVVSLVGADAMSVKTAIPVIMGANIGTSVTNTLVAVGQINDPIQFERAFSGATVHDMFNFMSVGVLLIIELITNLLFHMSDAMIQGITVTDDDSWEGPIKKLVAPLVNEMIIANKDVIKGIAKGTATCASFYEDPDEYGLIKCDDEAGCPLFYGTNNTLDDDLVAAGVCLFLSLVILCLCLTGLVTTLKSMVMNSSEEWIRKATDIHPFLAMCVGTAVTLLVQSSSITTSVLTPLVGLNVITVEQMFPLTLGANIGTTGTAVLASLVSDKVESVQIALVHLLFNVFGILIWYPIPWMRQWPLRAAKGLGSLTARWKGTPFAYILGAFLICPGILLGISSLFAEGNPAYSVVGVMLILALVGWTGYVVHWWHKKDGRRIFLEYLEFRELRSNIINKEVVERWEHLIKDVETLKQAVLIVSQTRQANNALKGYPDKKGLTDIVLDIDGVRKAEENSEKRKEQASMSTLAETLR